ncbi:MAG: hypothetical protein ABEI06_05105 [Halobacteriaceae archaeon]
MSNDSLSNEGVQALPTEGPRASIEAYKTDDGVVLYDAENPLAWVKATHALTIKDQR